MQQAASYLDREEPKSAMVRLLSVHEVGLHGINTLIHNDQIAISYRSALCHAGCIPWGRLMQHHGCQS